MNEIPQHDDLPLPDYDHLPTGVLSTHVRGLDEAGLTQVLAYERAHGNRLPVIELLEHRLREVQAGAEPSEVPAQTPEVSQDQAGTTGPTAVPGPPVNPPSHGTPFNPAQPR